MYDLWILYGCFHHNMGCPHFMQALSELHLNVMFLYAPASQHCSKNKTKKTKLPEGLYFKNFHIRHIPERPQFFTWAFFLISYKMPAISIPSKMNGSILCVSPLGWDFQSNYIDWCLWKLSDACYIWEQCVVVLFTNGRFCIPLHLKQIAMSEVTCQKHCPTPPLPQL